jgi:hypothetical protein
MFRLVAMLPAVAEGGPVQPAASPEQLAGDDGLPAVGPVRAVLIGFATAALMFVVLPMSMLLGVN